MRKFECSANFSGDQKGQATLERLRITVSDNRATVIEHPAQFYTVSLLNLYCIPETSLVSFICPTVEPETALISQ